MSIQRAADPPINFIISGPPPSASSAVASIANCDRAITFGSGDDDDGVGGGGGGGEVEDEAVAIISARLIRFMNWQNQGN